MSYLKKKTHTPPPKRIKRKNSRKRFKRGIKPKIKNKTNINIDDLTENKRLNPLPAQPWLRRPENFYESFLISGPCAPNNEDKCKIFYSYPKQPKDFEKTVNQFCFPEGVSPSPKKFKYGGERSKNVPKYETMIGSEIEHYVFMLTGHESLLYGYCIKIWYPFGFLPSFVEKAHPICRSVLTKNQKNTTPLNNFSLDPQKTPTTNNTINNNNKNNNNNNTTTNNNNNKKKKKNLKSPLSVWGKWFQKCVRTEKNFSLTPLCFCLLSKTSFIELNFEILHSIIAFTNLELLRMRIFRQIYFSNDTIRRILIVKSKKKSKKNIYHSNDFLFKGSKRKWGKNIYRKTIPQNIEHIKSIEKQFCNSAPTPVETELTGGTNSLHRIFNNNYKTKKNPNPNTNMFIKPNTNTNTNTNTTPNIIINHNNKNEDGKNNFRQLELIDNKTISKIERDIDEILNKKLRNNLCNHITNNGNNTNIDKKNSLALINNNNNNNHQINKKISYEVKIEKKTKKEKIHIIHEFFQQLQNLKIPKARNMMFLSVGGGLKKINYIIPDDLELCRANFSFKWIFSILSLENILQIINFSLLEKSIVFLSKSLRVLSCVSFAISPLIAPFRWQGAIMPIIPSSLMSFIESPVPVMFGITQIENNKEKFYSDYLLVDLDKNKIDFIQNATQFCSKKNIKGKNKKKKKKKKKKSSKNNNAIPKLPSCNQLLNSLKKIFLKYKFNLPTFLNSKNRGADAIKALQSCKRSAYIINIKEEKIIAEIIAVFAKYYNLLFTSYRNHTFSDVSSKDICTIFLTESFLESVITKDKTFMEQLLKTQSFYQFSSIQLEKIQMSLSRKFNNNTNPEIAMITEKESLIKSKSKHCELYLYFRQDLSINLKIIFNSKIGINNKTNLIKN
ncbi:suppression of tumorigenicity 5 st5 [Anaeramoeba flamelloides]|uniref:Suppression of tumorigenicity 5 st5 n=1 Tax=Anaeramoeba flamelloides TaxID=1746091 RepID=A0ABQ8XSE5_9EUKA|nr:suppression of tumorigenicity 5 st5 [Anaeramoeba flamelloides]